MYSWDMSVDCLVPSSTLSVSLVDKLIAGTRVLLTFTDGSNQNRAGYAYVKNCSEGGTVGSLATFNASFEADGALYKYRAYNNGSWPQEGKGYELSISQNAIRFNYDSESQDEVYVVEINPGWPGKVILFANDVWAILGITTASQVYGFLNSHNTQTLEENTTKFGNSDSFFALNNAVQYCTIVCNAKPIVLFLYE